MPRWSRTEEEYLREHAGEGAKAVADALVGLGVQQSTLAVDWKGKTDLAVPTPDGVKEPLNRRSTISINF